ncbi:aldo/keto reductase [Couchioplanes azureus]|uniref:aldo/keto reductase n=1 Tax=Couchioplanes caeruleus TaxID=56438 RepID=UPI0019A35A43|nr:aldo/keto reductase [Couchioplanes caeruleus]GGQ71711.1 oxidoreductase [Couchioplanes caeruleus subsp. azureus]
MELRRLGNTGPLISRLALGAMTFGQEADEPASFAILDAFVEAGGTLIDTADVYADGRSEEIVGRWLRERPGLRDGLVIATKARFPVTGQPGAGLSRDYLQRALEASLRRLGLDRIDVYQAHGPDPRVPLDEFAQFVGEALDAGKIAHSGLSNFTGWQVALAHAGCARRGIAPPVSLQPQYSLLVREPEWELLPAVESLGMGTMVWGPLGAGWLTGKYRRGQGLPSDSRLGDDPDRGLEAVSRRGTERTWHIVETLLEVADQHGLTPAQTALAWVMDRPGVTAALVGARTAEQLRQSLTAADLHLDPAATERLDAVSAPPTPDYPYAFIAEISATH